MGTFCVLHPLSVVQCQQDLVFAAGDAQDHAFRVFCQHGISAALSVLGRSSRSWQSFDFHCVHRCSYRHIFRTELLVRLPVFRLCRRIARRGEAKNGLGNLEIQVQVSSERAFHRPRSWRHSNGMYDENDRHRTFFIHFISTLLLPKKSNSPRIAELQWCALVLFFFSALVRRGCEHFIAAAGRLCIRSARSGGP